jgi:hypothetical protein
MAVELEAQDVHMFHPGGRLAGRCGLSGVIGPFALGNLKEGPPSPPLKRFLRALDKTPLKIAHQSVFKQQRFSPCN